MLIFAKINRKENFLETNGAEVRGENRRERGRLKVRFSEYLSFAFDLGSFCRMFVFGFLFVCFLVEANFYWILCVRQYTKRFISDRCFTYLKMKLAFWPEPPSFSNSSKMANTKRKRTSPCYVFSRPFKNMELFLWL